MKTAKSLIGILTITAALALQVQAQTWLTNGLVAFFPFNGNANDESGNGADAVVHGAILTNGVNGLPGSAFAVYGFTTNHIDGTGINLSNSSLTVAFWVRRDVDATSPIESPTISLGFVGSSGKALRIYKLDYVSVLRFTFWNDDFDAPVGDIGVHSWTHLACTYDRSTQQRKIFVNGLPIATNTAMYGYTGDSNFNFGAHPNHMSSFDQIRFYNRALSDSEVAQLYKYESGPRIDLIKAVKPSFAALSLGTNYQLQVSGNLVNWTNQGTSFTATSNSMIYPQYWDVDNWNNLFFRLQVVP